MPLDIYLFFLFSILLLNILDPSKALLGINVRQAEEKEFPFIVALAAYDRREINLIRFCAGALISNRDVLTSEHCLDDREAQGVRVIVGSNDLKKGKAYDTEWWVTYNQWVTYYDLEMEFSKNDMAVLRLSNNVTSDIKPVLLSSLLNRHLYGKNVTVAGWGDNRAGEIPTKMEVVELQVLTNKECESRGKMLEGPEFYVHERLLCTAASPYALLNYGDSGNPVIYENKIIGVSFGTYLLRERENHDKKVNLHFGTDYYREFIVHIKNHF